MREYYVYILTNRSGTLYVGVTDDLVRRLDEHRTGKGSKFTSRYRIERLMYFESGDDIRAAIEREKQIKGWTRKRRIALITSINPKWRDLSDDWGDGATGPLNATFRLAADRMSRAGQEAMSSRKPIAPRAGSGGPPDPSLRPG